MGEVGLPTDPRAKALGRVRGGTCRLIVILLYALRHKALADFQGPFVVLTRRRQPTGWVSRGIAGAEHLREQLTGKTADQQIAGCMRLARHRKRSLSRVCMCACAPCML